MINRVVLTRLYLYLVVFTCASCSTVGNSELGRLDVPSDSAAQVSDRKPETSLDQFLQAIKPDYGLWGLSAMSLATKKSLVMWNGDRAFIPASNMKLFTTAVALIRLGPDFRFTTSLFSGAPIINGVLKGDIVLRGTGDPTISDQFQNSSTAVFEDWAEQLKKLGISVIDGHIVGDDDLFDETDMGRGWSRDDDLFYYSARISALSFNENCIEVVVTPAQNPGEPATIAMKPHTSYMHLENHVITSPVGEKTDFRGKRRGAASAIELSGSIEKGIAPYRFKVTASNPTLFAVTVLKEVFEQKGIIVRGQPIDIDDKITEKPDYHRLRVLATYQSVPLSVIVRHTNKESHNLYAELLFRTLGATYEGVGSAENAARVIKQTLMLMGISESSLAIYDGSGLSRLNLITPNQIIRLLDYMAHHPYFSDFYGSLPIAGRDGTLAGRMKNTQMMDRLRAKTGSLAHTSTLSGYLRTGKDELVAFSLLGNNILSSDKEIRVLQESLCKQILTLELGK
jgi:serine-type D-Ala-D-Ala carboxypeptidase/endopeptidase (penicillin-binding protein 4)